MARNSATPPALLPTGALPKMALFGGSPRHSDDDALVRGVVRPVVVPR